MASRKLLNHFSKIAEIAGVTRGLAHDPPQSALRKSPRLCRLMCGRPSAFRPSLAMKVGLRPPFGRSPANEQAHGSAQRFRTSGGKAAGLITNTQSVHIQKARRNFALGFSLLLSIVHRRLADSVPKQRAERTEALKADFKANVGDRQPPMSQ